MFGLTGGEWAMSAFLFALIYGAGLLPRIVKRLTRGPSKTGD